MARGYSVGQCGLRAVGRGLAQKFSIQSPGSPRGRGGALCKIGHPCPTSEGLRKRQLAFLQVPLRHKPPPTQPGPHSLSARVTQEGLHLKKYSPACWPGICKYRAVGNQRSSPREAGGLPEPVSDNAHAYVPTPVCLLGLNLAYASTWPFSSSSCTPISTKYTLIPLSFKGQSWKMF